MKKLCCLDLKLGLNIDYRIEWQVTKNVASMYESLIPKLQKAAEVEKSELAIDNIEISDITPWDIRYFISKKSK